MVLKLNHIVIRNQPPVLLLRHHRVAQCQQAKKVVSVLLVRPDGIQQTLVVPLEVLFELRVEGEIHRFGDLDFRSCFVCVVVFWFDCMIVMRMLM